MPSYTHLTPMERGQIQAFLEQGLSQQSIADRLGRAPSSIGRELKRNGGNPERYQASRAQSRYHEVRKDCVPQKRMDHGPLRSYVIDKIVDGWTPETVAGRLPIDHPDDSRMRISHEALYQAIYADETLRFLIKYLPQARPKRRKRGQGKTRRGPSIPNRVGIEHRPKVVQERSRHGDWEGDLVVGANQDGFIVTLVDRKSRMLQSRKVQTKHATGVRQAVVQMLLDWPISWVKTITFDNGTEFAEHEIMAEDLPVAVYFAAPYASYQRGTNENTNGLIRRYLPKGTPFRDLSQERLDQIVEDLNNRPRKCLGYRTPNEVFQEQRREHLLALGS
ncbi:MAG: IS30 family transposase [Rhodopirellula sp.]|nr:IS30 family transposase [Rhodopirellula sp.]